MSEGTGTESVHPSRTSCWTVQRQGLSVRRIGSHTSGPLLMLGHYRNAHHPLSLMETTPFGQAQLPQEAPELQPACTAPPYIFLLSSGLILISGTPVLQDRNRGLLMYFSLSTPCLLSRHPGPSPCPPLLFPSPNPWLLPHNLWSIFMLLHSPFFPV